MRQVPWSGQATLLHLLLELVQFFGLHITGKEGRAGEGGEEGRRDEEWRKGER